MTPDEAVSANMRQFAAEQEELATTGKVDAPQPYVFLPEIYEPVVMTRKENITIAPTARIDSFVKLEGGVELVIGAYVHIASFAHIGIGGGRTLLGDFSAVASGARIISGSNQVKGMSMSACAPKNLQCVQTYTTRIGKYATVLTNAVVLPGINLGTGAVLAAGSVATKDIPAWEIWGGIPAKFIRKREVELDVPEGR